MKRERARLGKGLTNDEFRKRDELFGEACGVANCEPSKRQASKYRRGLGRAVKAKVRALVVFNQREIQRLWKEETAHDDN